VSLAVEAEAEDRGTDEMDAGEGGRAEVRANVSGRCRWPGSARSHNR
jgi:hypothetical protein